MTKKITYMIISQPGRARQGSLSWIAIYIAGIISVVSLVLLCYGISDYVKIKFRTATIAGYEQIIHDQQEELKNQRLHIDALADNINSLKASLLALNEFENRIRLIAGIGKGIDEIEIMGDMVGIGGSLPENIVLTQDLSKKRQSLIREMHQQVDQLDMVVYYQDDNFNEIYEVLEKRRNILAATPSIYPTRGVMTSSFGRRLSPFTGRREFHSGIDIAARRGSPIVATASGIISFAGKNGALGKTIVIDHGHGLQTRYAHLSKYSKKIGDRVRRGDVIALVGNSGRSTGPHLHYEVRLNGVPVNPKEYLLD